MSGGFEPTPAAVDLKVANFHIARDANLVTDCPLHAGAFPGLISLLPPVSDDRMDRRDTLPSWLPVPSAMGLG